MSDAALQEVLDTHTDKSGNCWIWQRSRDPNGYGKIRVKNKSKLVHRISWELANGAAIPTGLIIRHKCDNPGCLRPDHLLLGTHKDNGRDRVKRGPAPKYRRQDKAHLYIRGSLGNKFAAYANIGNPDECWLWKGGISSSGYGIISSKGSHRTAHRASYELHKGKIPEELIVRHKCDNPPCVNPDHLELGTHMDNVRDRVLRGRGKAPVGEKHGAAKLTEADVRDIRQRWNNRSATQTALGEEYGVSSRQIGLIVNRQRWKHIA